MTRVTQPLDLERCVNQSVHVNIIHFVCNNYYTQMSDCFPNPYPNDEAAKFANTGESDWWDDLGLVNLPCELCLLQEHCPQTSV